jgi:hypothetical protein
MFDKYIICEDGFQNVTSGDKTTGFQLKARLPYYRGLGISMVEDLSLKVDGESIPRQAIRVTLHGNSYTLDDMEQEYEDRWEFGEKGVVTVQLPGGLKPGKHKIELSPSLRISYLPFILVGADTKVLELAI